jgi:hypothetical protein
VRNGLWLVLLSALPIAVSADNHCRGLLYGSYTREPMVVVDTKDCGGNKGLASFRAERVFKVQTAECRDPDNLDEPLYQVLLHSLTGAGGQYEILWVDAANMQSIRQQLEENREAALRWRDCARPAAPQPDDSADN